MGDTPTEISRKKLLQQAFMKIEELQQRLEQKNRNLASEPIAVIGMGLRFPGGANSPDAFWELLRSGVNAVGTIPSSRWDLDAFYDPDPEKAGKMYARHGAFLDQIDLFDAPFFGITPREANKMDPQQRILLEVVWEALERSGQASEKLSGSNTGVFIGLNGDDYMNLMNRHSGYEDIDLYFGTGVNRSIAAGRISYTFGLKGPCVSLDTACSGSLVAVHLACQSLRMGECNMAVAGGITLMIVPDGFIGGSKGQMLSPEGRCKTFDAGADGYVRGEGCGIVALKRLKDALADEDHILSVIRGTAINQDGRSGGMTAPSGKAQEEVMHKALANANLTPGDIRYVETHGTGTVLGDPIEVQALGQVYGSVRTKQSPLLIGAVKTNVGHLEAAAGVAGLIKTIMIFKNGEIPPNLHFQTPNPHIPWSELPIEVVNKTKKWPGDQDRRIAAVSSFGFSGTNAHIILEAPPPREEIATGNDRNIHMLTLSAKSPGALRKVTGQYCEEIEKHKFLSMADMCFTANSGRVAYEYRLALFGKGPEDIRTQLERFRSDQEDPGILTGYVEKRHRPKIGFLFTGQGAQSVDMGKQLYENQPVFRKALERCSALAEPHLGTSMLSILYPDSDSGKAQADTIHQTQYAQPILFAFEYALAQMWLSWGIEPAFVMGHSVGEYVAACVAGVFGLEDGLRLLVARGRLMQMLPGNGAMAAVFSDADVVRNALDQVAGGLSIAAHNSPENTVISGLEKEVASVCGKLADDGILSKRLKVSHAFHSELVAPMVPQFRKLAEEIDFRRPRYELVSNVTGRLIDGDEITCSDYWCRHILQPVRFRESISALIEQRCDILLEIGPHPTLIPMASQCLEQDDIKLLPSLRRGRDDWEQVLKTAGRLFILGASIDRAQIDAGFKRHKIPLPTYPFEGERYWAKLSKPRNIPAAADPESDAMLGRRLRSPKLKHRIWEKRLDIGNEIYLRDHHILGKTIVPATYYLEMGMSAGRALYGETAYRIEGFNIFEPLVIDGAEPVSLQTVVEDMDGENCRFEIYSLSGGQGSSQSDWKRHASGLLSAEPSDPAAQENHPLPQNPEEFESRGCEQLDGGWYYRGLISSGVEYGPSFRGLEKIWRTEDAALGHIIAPEEVRDACDGYHAHPAVLDTCLQLLGITLLKGGDLNPGGDIYLPMGLESYRVLRSGWHNAWAHVTLGSGFLKGAEIVSGDIRISDDSGDLLAEISGLRFKRATADALEHTQREEIKQWLYEPAWRKINPVEHKAISGEESDNWLILSDRVGIGEGLAEELQRNGCNVQIVFPGETYSASADGSIEIDPLSAEDYVQIVKQATSKSSRRIGIIHLWNLDLNEEQLDIKKIETAYDLGCLSLVHLIQALSMEGRPHDLKLTMVTAGAVAVDDMDESLRPQQSAAWGLGRVIATEFPRFDCAIVDIDPRTPQKKTVERLLDEVTADVRRENQVALRQEGRLGLRLVRYRSDRQKEVSIDGATPYQLEIGSRGVIENLRLAAAAIEPPPAGQVQIQLEATGQNFRDVLNVLDMYPGEPGPLGNECVGRISALGAGVEGFREGDPVLALTPRAFCSHVNAKAEMVVLRPEGLSVEAAATIPMAFLTADYALNHIGRMKPGERLLIHAAAGGVGMAALQLAQRVGVEIFATAGSPEKRDYLRSQGVRYVMNSRTLDFADEIMAATHGEGIDIVLNSLSGDFIRKSISTLRKGGRFLELGKTDLKDAEKVHEINPQVSYHAVFLGDICQKEPSSVQALFSGLMDGFRKGELAPLPVKLFSIEDVETAFRFMAQARHIGKIVIDQRPSHGKISIRSDATYLITGGTGGLGLSFAKWLVDQGATTLILSARRPDGAKTLESVEQLKQNGARVILCKADMAKPADVEQMLAMVDERHPLRGIIHAAGVIEDAVLLNQNRDHFKTVIGPKAQGAWLLHSMTRHIELDFFVMCSAGAALFGSAGQGNYAAANAFMDCLAFARRKQGLPAASINWGPWEKVGMAAAAKPGSRRQWSSMGMGMIQPWQGCLALEQVIKAERPQIAVLPMDWERMKANLQGGISPALVAELIQEMPDRRDSAESSDQKSDLRSELDGLDAEDRYDRLMRHVRQQISEALELKASMEIKADQGLTDLGMDSLMAVEISNRLKRTLSIPLPSTLAFEYPTLSTLTDFLAQEVLDMEPSGASDRREGAPSDIRRKVKQEVDQLSDQEVEANLLRELDDSGY